MKANKYWKFLVSKEQLPEWLLMFVITAIGGFGIYLCYPYPDTISDSFGYLRAAIDDCFFIFRPFGYSMFLQFIHLFSSSITSILCSQLLILLISSAMLILAIKCYFPIKRIWIRIMLILLMILNPVALYLCNCIMSDVLFTSEIFVMLAMMVVLFHEPSWSSLILFSITFVLSLFTRYSAIFFAVAFIPFFLMIRNNPIRWTSILLICISILFYHKKIETNMYEATHLKQFSTGFDGWQWANNGIHVLPFLTDEDLELKHMPHDRKVRDLHKFSVRRYDSLLLEKTCQGKSTTAAMLWINDLPLKQYMFQYMQTTGTPYVVAWAKLGGELYGDYGKWLIKSYPILFWQHYLLPNITQIFFPKNTEIVANYTRIDAGKKEICEWFSIPESQPMDCKIPIYKMHLKRFLPWIELCTWLLFICSIIALGTQYRQFNREHWMVLSLVLVFGFIFYGTTTFASPIVIRYWLPMQLLKFVPLWLFLSIRKV